MFPKTTSAQLIQRQYRKIFNDVMESKEYVVVLSNNKPEVVITDFGVFEDMQEKITAYEIELAKKAIAVAKKEARAGKLKKLDSLAELIT